MIRRIGHKGIWFVATALAVGSVSAAAFATLSASKDAQVGFEASGPGGMKIDGTTGELNVTDADGNLVIDVPLANLSTGIALRDHHMKEKYLEVPKYPSATLIVSRATLKLPAVGAHTEGDAPGTVKMHGREHLVTVHYDAKGEPGGFSVNGEFHVLLGDFGISVPSYLGVTVKPDVDVTATFHVTGS